MLGATVHVLDDGFQHLQLARDLDIVVTPAGALAADHVLPEGRLREPIDVLARASMLVVVGADEREAAAEAARYGVRRSLGATRRLGAPVAVHGGVPPPGARVVALAGIGQPAQFVRRLAPGRLGGRGDARLRRSPLVHARRTCDEVAPLVSAPAGVGHARPPTRTRCAWSRSARCRAGGARAALLDLPSSTGSPVTWRRHRRRRSGDPRVGREAGA